MSVPVVHSSTFVASPGATRPGDLGYGRWTNPTWEAFETTLGALERGRARLFASGMAAVAAVLDQVPDGGRVVAPAAAYNGPLTLPGELAGRGRMDVEWVGSRATD